jgi:hypothetical protein
MLVPPGGCFGVTTPTYQVGTNVHLGYFHEDRDIPRNCSLYFSNFDICAATPFSATSPQDKTIGKMNKRAKMMRQGFRRGIVNMINFSVGYDDNIRTQGSRKSTHQIRPKIECLYGSPTPSAQAGDLSQDLAPEPRSAISSTSGSPEKRTPSNLMPADSSS